MPEQTSTNSTSQRAAFEAAGQEKPPSQLGELLHLILENKKWWLIPILVVMSLIGALVFLGSTGAAPFIYTLF